MNAQADVPASRVVVWLASATGLWLLFNPVAMPFAWGGISASGGVLGVIQTAILLGFLLVLLFDLVSLFWIAQQTRAARGGLGLSWLHFLALLALVGLMGAKVMVDEIARETPLGGAGGEWGILYALLILQLSFIIVVLFRAKSPADGS